LSAWLAGVGLRGGYGGLADYLKIPEVARRLDVSEPTVRRMVKGGRLPSVFIGGAYRVSEADLEEFLENAKVQPGKAQAPSSREPSLLDGLEERHQLRTEVENFISEGQEALDYPDLTQDIAYQISAEATDLLLKAIEVKNSASREKGYTYKELNDISFAHDQIMEFSDTANRTFLNKFGKSAKGQELESRRLRAVQESA
jgi:excisionase family DNA binding protein